MIAKAMLKNVNPVSSNVGSSQWSPVWYSHSEIYGEDCSTLGINKIEMAESQGDNKPKTPGKKFELFICRV